MSPAKAPAKKKPIKPPKPPKKPTLNQRVDLLERQVRFLMEKTTVLEARGAKSHALDDITPVQNAKLALMALFEQGESRTIDELTSQSSLQQYPWEVLEKAVLDLVDDETFDVSEGISKLKVAGKISRIIRR